MAGAKPSNGQTLPVFSGGEPSAHVCGQHCHLQAPAGHPARNFVHVRLDPTEQWRKAGGNHGHS